MNVKLNREMLNSVLRYILQYVAFLPREICNTKLSVTDVRLVKIKLLAKLIRATVISWNLKGQKIHMNPVVI